MSIHTYIFPKETRLGIGSVSELANIPLHEKNCVIVCGCGGSIKKSGTLDAAVKILENSGRRVSVFDAVEAEVSVETVDRAAGFIKKNNAGLVIGIGGGSALDCAKAAATVAPQNKTVKELLDGAKPELMPLPIVAVPTTAGTGSEVTRNAVLTYTSKKIKTSLRHNDMVPFFVILDPALTAGMNAEITAYTGMDALTHSVESYYSNGATDLTAAISLRCIDTIIKWLPEAIAHGSNMEAREKMLYASYEAGLAFGSAGLGAAHGIGHPVGSVCKIHHGTVNAILLPHVLKHNIRNSKNLRGGKSAAEKMLRHIQALLKKSGLPLKMSSACAEYESHIDEIARLTVFTGSMAYNPVKMTDESVLKILKEA